MNKRSALFIFTVLFPLLVFSQAGPGMRSFIKEMEGFSTSVYKDGSHLAVGYGHHLRFSPTPWVRQLHLGDTVSVQACELLFELDMNELVGNGLVAVYRDMGMDYPSNVYDVMGSLIYNLGLDGLRKSTFYRLFLQGKYEDSFTELLLLKSRSRGVWNRRHRELRHLLKNYDSSAHRYSRPPGGESRSVR